jgi:hypothetical protein
MCNCGLAGTPSCNYCSNNPNAERPPVVRSSTVAATDSILYTGQMFNSNLDIVKKAFDEINGAPTTKLKANKIVIGEYVDEILRAKGIIHDPNHSWAVELEKEDNMASGNVTVNFDGAKLVNDFNNAMRDMFIPVIDRVVFNGPETIVFWTDGTKTVVKCGEGEKFDAEKGIAMAFMKKCHGNKGSYYNEIRKAILNAKCQKPAGYLVDGDKGIVCIRMFYPMKDDDDGKEMRYLINDELTCLVEFLEPRAVNMAHIIDYFRCDSYFKFIANKDNEYKWKHYSAASEIAKHLMPILNRCLFTRVGKERVVEVYFEVVYKD